MCGKAGIKCKVAVSPGSDASGKSFTGKLLGSSHTAPCPENYSEGRRSKKVLLAMFPQSVFQQGHCTVC